MWITSEYTSPEVLLSGAPVDAINALYFHEFDNGVLPASWVKAGAATITLTIIDERELIDNKAAQLRAEIQKTQADAEVRVNALKEKLQSLLAITYQPEEVQS